MGADINIREDTVDGIVGTVTYEERPIEGAHIIAFHKENREVVETAYTDEKGVFNIERLDKSKKYYIIAEYYDEKLGKVYQAKPYKGISPKNQMREFYEIEPKMSELIFEDMRYDVNFTVKDITTDETIEDAEITIENEPDRGTHNIRTETTDSDGEATIESILVDGEFGEMKLDHPDYHNSLDYNNIDLNTITVFGMDGEIEKYINTTVYLYPLDSDAPHNDKETFDLHADFGLIMQAVLASVEFEILNLEDSSLENAEITFNDYNDTKREYTTDSDGKAMAVDYFRFDEDYQITIKHDDPDIGDTRIIVHCSEDEHDRTDQDEDGMEVYIYEKTYHVFPSSNEIEPEFIDLISSLSELVYEDMRYDVHLTIIDYYDDTPVEGADVTMENEEDRGEHKNITHSTDADGEVMFEAMLLEDEMAKYQIEHSDYHSLDYENIENNMVIASGMEGEIEKYIESTTYIYDGEKDNPALESEKFNIESKLSKLEYYEIEGEH